jgi:uncharacterized membrane protein YphA (DoxX/SURF4 family)
VSAALWSKLETLIAWVVGCYFICAAYYHIENPAKFAESITLYKMVPLWAVNAQAIVMPWFELIAGLALLVRPWRRPGAVIISVLLVVFIVAVSSAVYRGLNIDCGCTKHASKVGLPIIVRNVAMLGGMMAILWYRPRAVRPAEELIPASEPAAG